MRFLRQLPLYNLSVGNGSPYRWHIPLPVVRGYKAVGIEITLQPYCCDGIEVFLPQVSQYYSSHLLFLLIIDNLHVSTDVYIILPTAGCGDIDNAQPTIYLRDMELVEPVPARNTEICGLACEEETVADIVELVIAATIAHLAGLQQVSVQHVDAHAEINNK